MPEKTTAAEAMGWLGADLAELGGAAVGQVQGLYVDAESGEPAWLIARLGRRRRARIVAVPFANCAGAPFGVWVAQEVDAPPRWPRAKTEASPPHPRVNCPNV